MYSIKPWMGSIMMVLGICFGAVALELCDAPAAYAKSAEAKEKKEKKDKEDKKEDKKEKKDKPDHKNDKDEAKRARPWQGPFFGDHGWADEGHDGYGHEGSDETSDEDGDTARWDCPRCPRNREGYAQRVLRFQRGPATGQNRGTPRDALGPPDARPPSTDGLVSLGRGGRIVLGFLDPYIVDRRGPDFVVYEGTYGHFSVERARFAVSQGPGMPWVRIEPQRITGDDIFMFWFDLRGTGLECARLLLIQDDGDAAAGGNGFDLDAVKVLHGCGRR